MAADVDDVANLDSLRIVEVLDVVLADAGVGLEGKVGHDVVGGSLLEGRGRKRCQPCSSPCPFVPSRGSRKWSPEFRGLEAPSEFDKSRL